ncbi:MAG TPA: hypothetical protein VFT87_03880 [Candidatus Saccharimonadales bacterium]|nr:hypothetical protein [Candidatus Saccharimonadales bacterium]
MLSEIKSALAAKPQDQAWTEYRQVAMQCVPFLDVAVTHFARLTDSPQDKTKKYHDVIASSFDLLDDWYFQRKPYVKARRDEIDAVISFIRNRALYKEVVFLPAAASARHVAGALRGLVYMAVRGYQPEMYPHLMANGLSDIAAAKTLFPIDFSDAVAQFAKADESPSDTIDDMLASIQRAAKHFGAEAEYAAYRAALDDLWRNFDSPKPWQLPDPAWKPQKNSILAQAHQESVREFHAR